MNQAAPRGMSARLKLTLSYAVFLLVAGVLLLAVVWLFLLRYVPEDAAVSPGPFFPGRQDLIRAFVPPAFFAIMALLALGLVGGWFLAGRMLAPLTRITAATRLAAEGSLTHRIALDGPHDEFRELADSFDGMLERIEAHVAEQRRFAANASHELRTPLATMGAMLEVAAADPDRDVDELVQRLATVTARATALIEALLLLSRADSAVVTADIVDMSLLVEDVVETLLPLAEEHGIAIDTVTEVAPARGSHALLLQLAMNLVHNAIVHNLAADGTIRVVVAATVDSVDLTVENSGDRIDPAVVPLLTERFQRATGRTRAGHEGVGLGLAIAASIVRAHRGALVLGARPQGGLTVTVRLPSVR